MRASVSRTAGRPQRIDSWRPLAVAAVFSLFVVAVYPFLRPATAPARAGAAGAERPATGAGTRAQQGRLFALPRAPLTSANTVLAFPGPPVSARAAYLVDLSSGKVLYQKNANARLPMASTTKITTAAVVLHHARLSEIVTVSRAAASIGESTMELRQGERLTVRDLLYGLLLNSGNDAAVALAERIAGTQAHFVAMMNRLARRLHMTNTHYTTPHGLDARNHFTSARDLATVAIYAMRSATFRQIVATTDYHIPKTKHNVEHYLGNINKALYWYPGVDGVKPGDTDAAGLCQVVSTWRNGRHVLAVLLHTPNLATDLRNLLNFGTRDFQWVPSIYAPDGPTSTTSGGTGDAAWTYFYGAGHYVRGPFLHYFQTHGGLAVLGFPRTEQILDPDGYRVQFFQGAELVYDPLHDSAYPAPLGRVLADITASTRLRSRVPVALPFRGLYGQLGGRGVLGRPLTPLLADDGVPAQFYQYGELAEAGGVAVLVPAGDAVLRLRGLLPASGAGDAYLPDMAPTLADRYRATPATVAGRSWQ